MIRSLELFVVIDDAASMVGWYRLWTKAEASRGGAGRKISPQSSLTVCNPCGFVKVLSTSLIVPIGSNPRI